MKAAYSRSAPGPRPSSKERVSLRSGLLRGGSRWAGSWVLAVSRCTSAVTIAV